MRLQSAIFVLEETLPGRGDAAKVLSILKMEGVWLYAVTDGTRTAAAATLDALGLADCFRGVLTADEAQCPATDARMLEKAMRRLRSTRRDTVVFAGRLDTVRRARAAGFRTAAVGGAADAAEWALLCAEAETAVASYAEFLA